MVRSSMDIGDSMFARPEQPASDPCVRVFAELALKEIRGSDLSLLSDKEAFSEFMDKVNESVLLGHREPPSAASAIGDDDKTSSSSSSSSASSSSEEEEEEEGKEEPSSFQTVIGRSTASPGFDAKNNKNNSDPFTNATVFSRISVPRRVHHRDRRASGSLASPSLAPGGRSRVRFDVHGEKGYAREKVQGKIPEKVQKKAQEKVHGNVQRRKHGDPAGGREGLEGGGEANKGPLISDLGGENLLQELRRWRSRALIEMRKARPPSFPRPPTSLPPPPTSHHPPPPPPPLSSSPQRVSPVHRSSHDRLSSAAVRVDRGAAAITAERAAAQRSYEEGVFFSGGRETRTLAELAKGVGGSGKGGGGEGGDCGTSAEATLTAAAISEVLGGHHDQTQNEAEEVQPPPPPLPPSILQLRTMAASSGRGGGVVPSGGGMVGGRDRGAGGDGVSSGGGTVDRREGGGGLAGRRRVEEEAMELSLDLSDCSDEKLGHLLERGPRRGSSLSESQGGREGGGGRGGGHGAHSAVYAC